MIRALAQQYIHTYIQINAHAHTHMHTRTRTRCRLTVRVLAQTCSIFGLFFAHPERQL